MGSLCPSILPSTAKISFSFDLGLSFRRAVPVSRKVYSPRMIDPFWVMEIDVCSGFICELCCLETKLRPALLLVDQKAALVFAMLSLGLLGLKVPLI